MNNKKKKKWKNSAICYYIYLREFKFGIDENPAKKTSKMFTNSG